MKVIVKSLIRKLYDVPERREKGNRIARKLGREDLTHEVEKMIPIEEPFEKARTIGAKDKKKRKRQGKYWDNPNRLVHGYPKAVVEATVHQAAKDWGVPKSQVRKLLKEKLAQRSK